MVLMRITERAYSNSTEDKVRNSPNSAVHLTFPDSHVDPEIGEDLDNQYLDQFEYCEKIGFDGQMLKEHHNTPTCLEAATLARPTRSSKIVLLGNPLPIFNNPVLVAEEPELTDPFQRTP